MKKSYEPKKTDDVIAISDDEVNLKHPFLEELGIWKELFSWIHENFQPEQNQNFDHIEEAFQKHKEKKAKRESDRAKYGIYDDPQDDYNSRHAPGEQIMFPTKPNKVVFPSDPTL